MREPPYYQYQHEPNYEDSCKNVSSPKIGNSPGGSGSTSSSPCQQHQNNHYRDPNVGHHVDDSRSHYSAHCRNSNSQQQQLYPSKYASGGSSDSVRSDGGRHHGPTAHKYTDAQGARPATSYLSHSQGQETMSRARGSVNDVPYVRRERSASNAVGNATAADLQAQKKAIKKKLDSVLGDKHKFMKSAKASFQQFDSDGSNSLSKDECRRLMDRLVYNLQLPPCDDNTLMAIFDRFNTEEGDQMCCTDFCMMFWQILWRVRNSYYPDKDLQIRRSFFVNRVALGENQIRRLFSFEKKLGTGSFGEAHLVIERSSKSERCCKIINKDKATVPIAQIQAEVAVLEKLDHPNIIKIYEVYEDYHNLYIIQELCQGGEVLKRVMEATDRGKVLTEKYVKELIRQLLNALAYIHDQHVVHKDLKPENILFQDLNLHSNIKVIDFGLSEMFKRDDECSQSAAGTVLYMAPEVFARRITTKCDLWSTGCVMFLLLTGHLPFQGRNLSQVKTKILRTEPNYDLYCRHLSKSATDFLKALLTKNPKQRPTAKECLEFPWVKMSTDEIILDENVCQNLRNYTKFSGLKAALINMMTHQLDCNGSQVKRLSEMFIQFDTDHSGTLSAPELHRGLTKAGFASWDVDKIIRALDIAGTGEICYTEFLAAAYTWRESEINVMWTAFNKLDRDGDGKISIDQFMELLNSAANARCVHKDDIAKLLESADTNHDGLITWDEFLAFMRGQ